MDIKESLLYYFNSTKYSELDLGKLPTGAYGDNDTRLLFSTIKFLSGKKSLNILEISPDKGKTTAIMLQALTTSPHEGHLIQSYDVHSSSESLDIANSKITRKLYVGDAKTTVLREDVEECDFLFLDSDHTYSFGEWYAKDIIPYIKSNTLIFVHDWPMYESDGSDRNRLPIFPQGRSPNLDTHGEPLALKRLCVETNMVEPVLNTTDLLFDLWGLEVPSNPNYSPNDCTQVLVRREKI